MRTAGSKISRASGVRILRRVGDEMRHIFAFVVLALVAKGRLASAQQYNARQAGEVIHLEDTRNQMVVSIIPSLGNIVSEFSVKGHNVLRWPYASLEDYKARGGGLNGIPFLGPWANRLDEQAFYANGRKYNFDMELGNVRGAIPIHGFLTATDQWQVMEVKADGKSAWVTSKLEVWKHPMWMKQWPFAHTIEITHRLQDGVLQVQTKITNLSVEAMPVAVGFHPYYQLTDSPRENWTITVPAKTRYLLSGAKLPTGETEPSEKLFPNRQGTLKDYNLDDVFGDLDRDAQGRAHTILKGKEQTLDIMFSQNYQAEVIYSPNPTGQGLGSNALQNPNAPARGGGQGAGRGGRGPANPLATPNYICVEPMPGITNAINLAQKGTVKNLQSVAPNQTWEASFWVKPNGF
jgi:aldose 1-epimerase